MAKTKVKSKKPQQKVVENQPKKKKLNFTQIGVIVIAGVFVLSTLLMGLSAFL